jgi:hypothetical protein
MLSHTIRAIHRVVRSSLVVVVLLSVVACKKSETPVEPKQAAVEVKAAPPKVAPTEVALAGAYHAVKCGDVTAVWSGSADELKDLAVDGKPAPKSYGVTGLTFRFADGKEHAFTPSGSLNFDDWSFDIFSPDCSRVSLLQDRFGPFTIIATKDLATFANALPVIVEGSTASVHGQWTWTGPESFEFVASCCGGALVMGGKAVAPITLEKRYEASSAPSGIRRAANGWEVVK